MTFREKINSGIVFLDGALGTYAESLGLREELFAGKEGCFEWLSLSSPDTIFRIHEDYFAAGSDAVETNTFGGNALKLGEYGLADEVYRINLESCKIARKAADRSSSASFPRYVIGTMGPTGRLPSSSDPSLGGVGYDVLKNIYREQASGILDGGADALLIETGQDLLEMKAAVNGAKEAIRVKGRDVVLMAQCTLSNNGRMLLGTEVSAVAATLGYMGVDVIGINCGSGPAEMETAVSFLGANSPVKVSCLPNAGLPVESGGRIVYPLGPDEMASYMERFVREYGVTVVGGCCGSGPAHIKAMRARLEGVSPAAGERVKKRLYASPYRAFDLDKVVVPLKVGERINTQGSRRMKELLLANDHDGIIEIAKKQESDGAGVLDVCSVLTERSTEEKDEVALVRELGESVTVPLMIDSTDTSVIESSLRNYPGTAFINSANMEDGGKRAGEIFAMASEHASFVVNLVIDEEGMARSVERKIAVAERLYRMAVDSFGMDPHRMIFDMLTFTLGTGDGEYASSAVDTLEAIKELKIKCPGALAILGVSNLSFGLPRSSRRILNMVFLHHAVSYGLDMAIINPSEYVPYGDIPENERALAEDLIFNRSEDALNAFVSYFGTEDRARESSTENMSAAEEGDVEQRIARCVIARNRKGIIPLMDEALKEVRAEDIVNGVLMDTMRVVGDKLDTGEMVLPYVLQAAEVVRTAIEHLRPHMGSANRIEGGGKVLLATVFGDVHDIGKNLVKMVFENNGFSVIDLGKQVRAEEITEKAVEHKADVIGLSALLVSTSKYIKVCVQALSDAGLGCPVIIGGAPLSEKFARYVSLTEDGERYRGGVFFAKDAFSGLKLLRSLTDEKSRAHLMEKYSSVEIETDLRDTTRDAIRDTGNVPVPSAPSGAGKTPVLPFYGARCLKNIPADEVFPHIDEKMLFEVGWGARSKDKKDQSALVAKEYRPLLEELKEESIRKGWLDLKASYGYFRCRMRGDTMQVLDEAADVLEEIYLKRSGGGKGRSIADFFDTNNDIVAFQAVTVGDKVRATIDRLNEKKEFTRAFFVHGFSVYTAEALAAYMHERICSELGIPRGRGKRYSPGYPLWDDLGDQEKIFRLLDVQKCLGVTLTEAYQMVPEQSTTAMIVHNERAEY